MSIKTILKIAGGFATGIYVADMIHDCRKIYDEAQQQYFSEKTSPKTGDDKNESPVDGSLRKDGIRALINLGYKAKDSKERVEDAIIKGKCNSVEDIIRYALTNGSK